ncbi:deoxyribose-phosphate aldolase [Varibaculum cambriense]|uniref:deoxyribose-phosphate aldolase n=1 Tax=Varibaculum cambriense TaxID=184870 RepID=UPI0025526B7F|nr:deoxyribose-phosphate aldolase [Varibaculum cambriense]MDK8274233.1 deoxyribose-phosphate aldolase [Varibaculum cambriense]
MIDHTLLKPDATKEQFDVLCAEARQYKFAMVAINPYPVSMCSELLDGSGVGVGAAISFPLGQLTINEKVNETRSAIADGATEIDYVVNITELKAGNQDYITEEMTRIVKACRDANVVSKVIFENCYLTDEEKTTLANIAREVKPDFIKTSTGFGSGGATLPDVKLMKSIVGDDVQVKASGGIRSLDDALAFVEAGATRIGTSSGVALVKEFNKRYGN